MTDELQYWIAFSRVPNVGRVRFGLLERHFGSLRDAWSASPEQLAQAGLDRRTVASILNARGRISPQQELERLEQQGVRALTWHDPEYPALLKETYDLPPVLYVRGNLVPEDRRAVCVVGTRQASAYGREAAAFLTQGLSQNGITIISGLARGLDTVAHQAALEAEGRTIAVLACGLDLVYPRENLELAREIARKGALVSEFPLGTRPEAQHFPRRNRIMSGLSLGVVVVEAGDRSGALITVDHALEQNREVFCVPGSIFSPLSKGANRLIQEGAKLVTSFQDVLEELNLTTLVQPEKEGRPPSPPPGSPLEQQLLQQLSLEPTHLDELSRRCGQPVAEVSGTLVMMQLKGLVREVRGLHYVRVHHVQSSPALPI